MNSSEVLREIRQAISKGWWNLSNIYKLHDKPLSEILATIDRSIALAEEDENETELRE